MNKTSKKIFSICCAVVTTLTATLFHSTNLRAGDQEQQIVFVGPEQAGKTKLVSRICENSYNSNYVDTNGINYNCTAYNQVYDLSGQPWFRGAIYWYLTEPKLCVLTISNKNQETEDFLNILATYNVPNVVLCITKTDEGIPASGEVSSLLDTVRNALTGVTGVTGVKVFDEVLYTSAKNNTFRFCTPDECNTSEEYQIYDTEAKKQVLAAKLYELCGRKAADFETATYAAGTSCDEYKTTTSKGKTYALGLGIPATLLSLILGIGYYEYDRHFRKQDKTKTETKSEQTPKVNRKISS